MEWTLHCGVGSSFVGWGFSGILKHNHSPTHSRPVTFQLDECLSQGASQNASKGLAKMQVKFNANIQCSFWSSELTKKHFRGYATISKDGKQHKHLM